MHTSQKEEKKNDFNTKALEIFGLKEKKRNHMLFSHT